MRHIENLLLLITMAEEARPVIEALSLKETAKPDPMLPMRAYAGQHGTMSITLVTNGADPRYGVDNAGTQAATLAAYLGIGSVRPDLVINAGTAGGFSERGGAIGKVYLAEGSFVFHDRRIPMGGYERFGEGQYPAVDLREAAKALHLATGVVSTGNSFDMTQTDRRIMDGYGAVAKEMEAAAMAQVAWMMGVPFTAIKAITDIVDIPSATEDQFTANFDTAVFAMTRKLVALIDFLEGA